MSRPKRLVDFTYTGLGAYFLTVCTRNRTRHFVTEPVVDIVLAQFVRTSHSERFDILAYCFMPDHVHMLIEALNESADMIRFAKMAKQRSGYAFTKRYGVPLWQEGYVDRVLRNGECAARVARDILENPLRQRLVQAVQEYPFCGSTRWTREELLRVIAEA